MRARHHLCFTIHVFLAIGSVLALGGCFRLGVNQQYAGPEVLPAEMAQVFGPPTERRVTLVKDRIRETTRHYRIRRIRLTPSMSLLDDQELVIDYYELRDGSDREEANESGKFGNAKHPLILVLPILGGGNEVANFFADRLARRGFACAIIHRQEEYKDIEEDMDLLNKVFVQIVVDHQQALDWLELQPGVDPDRIGLFGVSAGAIKGSLVYAVDQRVKAAVMGLTGGDLPYIFAHSSEDGIIEKRETIMKQEDLTREEFLEALRDGFEHDPLRYAPYMDAERALLILGFFDSVVPYETGLALRRAMGGPDTIIIPTGHYTSVLYLPLVESAAVMHFRRHLPAGR